VTHNGPVTTEAATLLGLLTDDDRLRAVAALALGARTPAEVASMAGIDVRRAGRALARLTSGGLVEQEKDGYRLVAGRFREALDSLGHPPAPAVDSGLGPDADKVLRAFLRDGRLTAIPAVHSKRLVVLDFLAGLFEPGQAYPETEVNERLARYHPDVAALRRYLVDEEFMHRRDGFYWRAGGTFAVDPLEE
jgi:DNA-binding transcriptional ArsR family regulator